MNIFFHWRQKAGGWSWQICLHASLESLKVLGKSVGICKTTKRKDQLYKYQFTCFCMENHLWKFQPKRTHISWRYEWKYKQRKEKELWFWRSVTVTLSHHYHRYFSPVTISFKSFARFGFLWHHLTILSPRNLALLHFTLLHSLYPVPFN